MNTPTNKLLTEKQEKFYLDNYKLEGLYDSLSMEIGFEKETEELREGIRRFGRLAFLHGIKYENN